MTKADYVEAFMYTEIVKVRTAIQVWDINKVVMLLILLGDIHDMPPKLQDYEIADAIRRLEWNDTGCSKSSNSRTSTHANTDPSSNHESILSPTLPPDRARKGPPSHDVVGYSLACGVSTFFDVYLTQYLGSTTTSRHNLTEGCLNYLLVCSIKGNLPGVALKFLREGANLHGTRPKYPDCPWVTRISDVLISLLFGHGECWCDHYDCGAEQQFKLNEWWQVLIEKQVLSHHSLHAYSFCLRNEDLYFYLPEETIDLGEQDAIFFLVGLGRCCQMVQKDIKSRGSGDRVRNLLEIAPAEHIGYAIDTLAGHFVPLQIETFGLLVQQDTRCWRTNNYRADEIECLNFERQALDHVPWMRAWFDRVDKTISYEDTNTHSAYSNSQYDRSYLHDPDLERKLEMFRTRAEESGIMYRREGIGNVRSLEPRFEYS